MNRGRCLPRAIGQILMAPQTGACGVVSGHVMREALVATCGGTTFGPGGGKRCVCRGVTYITTGYPRLTRLYRIRMKSCYVVCVRMTSCGGASQRRCGSRHVMIRGCERIMQDSVAIAARARRPIVGYNSG